jgi:hypothetical protein
MPKLEIDARAILGRVEKIVRVLRSCDCADKSLLPESDWRKHFTLDEAQARRVLRYFRDKAKRGGAFRHSPGWRAALVFLYDHGQCLTWVMTGEPAGMIHAGAELSRRMRA